VKQGALFVALVLLMMDFRKNINTTEGLVAFSFVRIYTSRGMIYFVSATGRTMRHHFHMEKRQGGWKIILAPKPPDFILQYEDQLAQVIKGRDFNPS
jgi:predicted dehydrogenase